MRVPGGGVFDCVATDQSCDGLRRPGGARRRVCVTARQPGDDGRWQLWCSDGTAAGTGCWKTASALHIVASEGQLYFTRVLDDQGSQLWRRGAGGCGVDAGRRRFPATSSRTRVQPGTGLPGGIAFDLVPADESWWSGEPWWSDGTPAGTTLLRDIRGDDAGSAPRDFVVARRDRAVQRRRRHPRPRALVQRRQPGRHAARRRHRRRADRVRSAAAGAAQRPSAVFVADDGVHDHELWRSDGTAAGTALVAEASSQARPPRILDLSRPPARSCTSSPTTAPTAASSGAAMVTAAGTALLADLNPGAGNGELRYSWSGVTVAFGDGLIFLADDNVHWHEPLAHRRRARRRPTAHRLRRRVSALAGGGGCRRGCRVGVVLPRWGRAEYGLWRSDGGAAGTQWRCRSTTTSHHSSPAAAEMFGLGGTDPQRVWRLDDPAAEAGRGVGDPEFGLERPPPTRTAC